MRILLIEDDRALCTALLPALQAAGYTVDTCHDSADGKALLCGGAYDVCVLDRMLPGLDGLSLLRAARAKGCTTPVLMLTALSGINDRVDGLDAGADDYLTKPFGVMELISRVKALLRRSMNMDESKILSLGEISIDNEKHRVSVQGQPCELTYKEFELLKLMLQNVGIVLSRDVIMERVWGVDFEGESRTLDMHIKTLRQKLGESGKRIKTVRNVGYRLE